MVRLASWGQLLLIALFFATGVGSVSLRADGKVFSKVALADPQIPDQRALIHYENGVERLVIDTSFKGFGTNFAWVVPLPSVPKIEPVTAGFFPTLQFLFQPVVIHDAPKWFWASLGLGFVLFTVLRAKRQNKSVWEILVVWFFIWVFAGMLLPALASAKGGDAQIAGLKVLQREKVGVYDTVTLSSTNGSTLLSWLATNGFTVPTNSLPVIQDYAREGWFFVASKLHLETNSSEPLKAHPLSFTFKTDRPVYPLRLTGVDNNTCKIDLYVFGTNQAASSHFKVAQSEQPKYETVETYHGPSGFVIGHPALTQWVNRSPVATKLTAELTSKDMKEDAYLEWGPYQHERQVLYSASGALTTVTNYASVPLVILLLVVYWVASGKDGMSGRGLRNAGITAASILLCCAVFYLALPKIAVTVTVLPRLTLKNKFLNMELILWDRIDKRFEAATNQPNPTLDFETLWLREQLKEGSAARQELGPKWQTNSITSLPWHEEDSPGNYQVRQESNDVVAVWYDVRGAENEFFRLSEARAK